MEPVVRTIMQLDVETISPRKSLADLQSALLTANVGGLPVVDSGQIVGMVSRSDVVKRLQSEREAAMRKIGLPPEIHLAIDDAIDLGEVIGERLEQIRVEHVMNRKVVTVSPDDSVRTAAERLTTNHIHRLPVVEKDHLVGLVSSQDIVNLVANGTLSYSPKNQSY